MCIQITEYYAICKCHYYTHAVDPCSSIGHKDHKVTKKTTYVGGSLRKELDTRTASKKAQELVNYYQKEEQQVKRHLSDRGVKFTDADLAPVNDGQVQHSIEAGSLQDLEQIAAATLDLTTKLKDTQD
ncbi:hypothetical protein Sste5344_010309 [Sporothrix stenoceras]